MRGLMAVTFVTLAALAGCSDSNDDDDDRSMAPAPPPPPANTTTLDLVLSGAEVVGGTGTSAVASLFPVLRQKRSRCIVDSVVTRDPCW